MHGRGIHFRRRSTFYEWLNVLEPQFQVTVSVVLFYNLFRSKATDRNTCSYLPVGHMRVEVG